MKKIYPSLLSAVLFSTHCFSQAMALWDFESSSLNPLWSGAATFPHMNLVGTTSTYVTGNPGVGLNTSGYPTQGTGSGTEGLEFGLSSTGNMVFGFDLRLSATASKYYQVQYTANGFQWFVMDLTNTNTTGPAGTVNDVSDLLVIPVSGNWYTFTVNLSSVPAVNNSSTFAVRVVSFFAPSTSTYVAVDGGTYNVSGTVRFDNIVIGQNNSLPIRLSSFNNKIDKDNKVHLNWETSSETNFSHFDIERSGNGISFTTIGSIPAKHSATGAVYEYVDAPATAGNFYYRLKTVNLDNSFEYSRVVTADLKSAATNAFTISPCPAVNDITIEFSKLQKGDLTIYDLDGRSVYSAKLQGTQSHVNINTGKLKPGYYIISLRDGEQVHTESFIKQ